MRILSIATALSLGLTSPALAQNVDFGDDSSTWSNDGECDDPRFEGPGMTATALLDEDIRADATDCRTAFEAGLLTLRGEGLPDLIIKGVNFGNDDGEWSNDNECDDPRFEGPGMTTTPLLSDDVLRDATDCSTAFVAGQLSLVGVSGKGLIDFGNDDGEWSNDGECDDMRFVGPGMTLTPLLSDDIMRDATDCRTAFEAGQLTLAGQ
mgnify:CR=1 FL=1